MIRITIIFFVALAAYGQIKVQSDQVFVGSVNYCSALMVVIVALLTMKLIGLRTLSNGKF